MQMNANTFQQPSLLRRLRLSDINAMRILWAKDSLQFPLLLSPICTHLPQPEASFIKCTRRLRFLPSTSRVIETTERRSTKSTFINLHGSSIPSESLPHSVEWAATLQFHFRLKHFAAQWNSQLQQQTLRKVFNCNFKPVCWIARRIYENSTRIRRNFTVSNNYIKKYMCCKLGSKL